MKVSILFKSKDGPWGGGNQFLKTLRKELELQGHYEEDPNKADVLLFGHFPFGDESLLREAWRYKKQNKIIVHRLYGPLVAARGKDILIDKAVYHLNKAMMSGTIFQSAWSAEENHRVGLAMQTHETIITNAPDRTLFHPLPLPVIKPGEKINLVGVSWSTNKNKGFDTYQYLDEHLDYNRFNFTFIGNAPFVFKNAKHVPALPTAELADELKKHHIYIHPSRIEACSNALLEGLHAGLPAVVYDSTSNPEVLHGAGATFKDNTAILPAIETVVNSYTELQQKISSLPTSDAIAEQYYAFMESIREKGHLRPASLWHYSVMYAYLYLWKIQGKVRSMNG